MVQLPNRFNVESLDQDRVEELMIKKAIVAAGQFLEENVEPLVEKAQDVEPSGASFTIPLVVPEGAFTGDNRVFEEGSITTRDLPLPLLWQINTASGHDGSVVIGRIDTIERLENGLGNARGVFDVGVYGREAERLVRNGFLRGISGDFDDFEATTETPENFEADDNKLKNEIVRISKARLMGATLVAKPAFQECFISLDNQVDEEIPDGEYQDEEATVVVASAEYPTVPPHAWFADPQLDRPTSLQVLDSGQVYGHLATWDTSHISMGGSVRPPHSRSNYKYFRSGVVRTDDGTDVTVGQLTLTHGHADVRLTALQAKDHYDNTMSAVVDVVAGEDQFGIWIAGALRPDVTPAQLRALRASGISGDWRPIDGRLELVAACCVNVAGFPTTRAMVAGGQIQALVAAGTRALVEDKQKEVSENETFASRIEMLEREVFGARMSELKAKMAPEIEEYTQNLSDKAQKLMNLMK